MFIVIYTQKCEGHKLIMLHNENEITIYTHKQVVVNHIL